MIRPLQKKPSLDPEEHKNYRPVSNLTFLSKVIENVISARLDTQMQVNHLHDPF